MKRRYIIFLFLVLLSSFSISVSAINIDDPISGRIISGNLVQQNLDVTISIDGPPSLVIVVPEEGTNFEENETVQLNFISFGADNFWYNVNGTVNITLTGNISISVGNGTYILYLFANNSFGVTEKGVSFTVAAEIADEEIPGRPRCIEDWECGGWSSCNEGLQTRSCSDLNACETIKDKPIEERDCVQGLCVDETPYVQCSSEQPVFCNDGGVLENKCSLCGCPAEENCLLSGACGIVCEDDDECPIDYECKQGVCWLEEKECLVDSDCLVDEFCDQGICLSLGPAPAPEPQFKLIIEKYGVPVSILILLIIISFIANRLIREKKEIAMEQALAFALSNKNGLLRF